MPLDKWYSYFEFTRRERIGILFLLLLIIIISILPMILPDQNQFKVRPDDPYEKELEQLQTVMNERKENKPGPEYREAQPFQPVSPHAEIKFQAFPFDPNNLPADEWKKLGIQDRTIITIQRYLKKGGRFRKPDDIGKIYGIHPLDVQRLLPYVRIETTEKPSQVLAEKGIVGSIRDLKQKREADIPASININTADTSAFIALPGIGSKLAQRIVNFREKLGGFYAVNQVAETFGLPDSTFQKIKSHFICNEASIRKININRATADELKLHPYIKWKLANTIIAYRQQHGPFQEIGQLEQIALMDPELLLKLLPYLSVQ